MDELLNLLSELDWFALAERVEAGGSALEVARRYFDLLNELYWKQKDLPRAIVVGTLGIHYALLRAAEQDRTTEAITARELRGVAKQMAYNIGSFAWPGWAEPGIAIGQAELASGRNAAQLNLRLAVELNRPPDRMANAHWLVGAYALADGRTTDAVTAFDRAAALNLLSADRASSAMNQAYTALAKLAVEPHSVARDDEFNNALKAIETVESEDSSFYVHQLKTARGVFVRSNAPW